MQKTIYHSNEIEIEKIIKNRKVRLCVIGVGTIGLAEAIFFATKEFQVVGLDVNSERVKEINNGTCICEYPDLLKRIVKNGKLKATTESKDALKDADFILVCVPTPVDKDKKLNYEYVFRAAESIGKNMKRGSIVVFESSVSPGSTMKFKERIESFCNFKAKKDFGLAYVPERYNPALPIETHEKIIHGKNTGEHKTPSAVPKYTIDKINRIVGAIDKKSLFATKILYEQMLNAEINTVSSIESAEAVKLTENIFRDVNIALVNELSKIFSKLRLDSFEIIDAAKTKQFAFLPHYPGVGVGGECIPVDTWYLIEQAEKLKCDTKIMRTSREVNDSMPGYTVEILTKAFNKLGLKINNSKIGLLGLAYKANIADVRVSPSFDLIKILEEKGGEVKVCDPIVENAKIKTIKLYSIRDTLRDADALLLATDHDIFLSIKPEWLKKIMKNHVIIDGRNFFDSKKFINKGFTFMGIGKPLGE
jgi:UDP-N-acetyl-D-mannosaminuronate dehydrogenase